MSAVALRDRCWWKRYVKYVVLHRLCQSELGWFGEVRRQGRETSRQRALNFNAADVAVLFPSACASSTIPIALARRDDDGEIVLRDHALRRQSKNWRLTGDKIPDRRFGRANPGDLVVMALDLDGPHSEGAFDLLPQDDIATRRILSDSDATELASNGLIAVPAIEVPGIVGELRALDAILFGSYLPLPDRSDPLNAYAGPVCVRDLEAFDVDSFEPESPNPAPLEDPSCRQQAAATQAAIDGHRPIDTDAGWADVPIDLPTEIYVLGRDGGLDGDTLVLVRELLKDGIAHGCVSQRDLDAVLCSRSGREPDLDFERRLGVVLDEFGVMVETRPWDEDLVPLGCRELTPNEEDLVHDALVFLMVLEPRGETDFETCQREVRAIPTLTDSEEAAMHMEIAAGTAETLDGIARSQAAVEGVLGAILQIDNGQKQLRTVVVCGGDDDMTARLEELRTLLAEVRAILTQCFRDGSDLIADVPARKIASIFSRCGFTPKYLDEVCGMLVAAGQIGDAGERILTGIRRSKAVRREIVASNLRLVVWWASQYMGRGLELVDLVGEGTLGLIRAVDRYDRGRGAALSTYGSWWIKQSITRATADKSGLIRTPVHAWKTRRQVLDHLHVVELSTGHRPTAGETAAALGIRTEAVKHLLGERDVISLDADHCREALACELRVPCDGLPETAASDAELREAIEACMKTLDPRLARVVQGRFGMGNRASQTLEEMGQALGVTRERVRQMEIKAISKLQHPSRARMLAPFLGDVRLPALHPGEHDDS